jgi:hypothetical protein
MLIEGKCTKCGVERLKAIRHVCKDPTIHVTDELPPPNTRIPIYNGSGDATGYDWVQRPNHYTWHPHVEACDLATYFGYNIGTAITYLFRSGHKPGNEVVQELKKAIRHIEFEINMLEGRKPSDDYPRD